MVNPTFQERADSLRREFDGGLTECLSAFKKFLSFKSISADPAFHQDCLDCADWVADYLKSMNFKVEIISTDTKPLVYAEYILNKKAPTFLFYGHYDVQPVDPLDLWESDPFQATEKNGRIYARGAQDNKGQVLYFLRAVESAIKNGTLNCSLKILIEGEEETGSKALGKVLPDMSQKLKADLLMVCDTGTVSPDLATITMGLRGILSLEVRLDGSSYDLHSGVHGGVVPNPATGIARLVSTLHTDDGKIAVKGYYDSVIPIDENDRQLANSLPFDLAAYEKQVGVSAVGGEEGMSFCERRGFRPTIEVNGIHSGYGGVGQKTIIPAYGIAKISARLAAGQEPEHCMQLIKQHLIENCPKGLKISFSYHEIGGPAVSISSKSPVIGAAKSILDHVCERGTALMWEGASVPIVPALAGAAGAQPLLVGFGLEEDCIHAPNESFGIEQLKKGFVYAAMMLEFGGEVILPARSVK